MGAMTPPSRKSCYNFRVTEINRVLDGDTIDVTIDLGFDLYKKERVRVAGVDTPEKRTRNLEEKALGIDATNWLKEKLEGTLAGDDCLLGLNLLVALANTGVFWVGFTLGTTVCPLTSK
jgi:micrococcal nuclease